ncbi:MAG: VTT domain-containing protein [Wenzhouxiangella sp.]
MENGLVSSIFALIESRPAWLVGAAFAFALLESLAIVGIVVPGVVLLFVVGTVVGFDPLLFAWCWLAASLGAMTGDCVSYGLGRRFRDQVPGLWPLRRRPELLAGGRLLFVRHGGKAVFIGRFIGPIRPVIPLLAGMLGLRGRLFLAFAIPAAILWAPLYLLPGMLFGASLGLAAEFAGRLVVLLLIVVFGIWFVVWVTRLIYDFTARRSGWWLKSLVRWTNRHPIMGRVVGDLLEPGRRQVLSVALLGLILGGCILALLSLLIIAPLAQPTWDVERQVGSLAASLRSHFADPLFVALSLAGEVHVTGLLAGSTALVLLALGRTHAAWHWAAAILGGWLLAEMIAGVMGLLLPAAEGKPGLAEVPHRAFVLATLVFGFFAVMLAKDLNARHRKWPYLATSALLALIAFAHFYLGRASLIGLLAAFALGLGWLALIGIGYRRGARLRKRPLRLVLMFYAAFAAIAAVEIGASYDALLESARLSQPERRMSVVEWQTGGWRLLPEQRSRLGSAEKKRFDLQLAGTLGEIVARLRPADWRPARIGSPAEALRRLTSGPEEGEDGVYLPRDFAGLPERMILIRERGDGRRLILRLWDSGTRLDGTPLWLGQVRTLRRERGLAGFERWREVTDQADQALATLLEELSTGRVIEPDDGPILINLARPARPSPARPAAAAHPGAPPDR